MKYRVSLTESAKGDIEYFEVHEQRIIVAGIIAHLKADAEVRTRKKKPLRPNPLAPWELRIGGYRVFYAVEAESTVKIVAVGHKEHNELLIRGRKVQL
ncbi:MAG: type II toxin-antitoxin system RelE/ParE family toxin [Acidobacteria bacterium]|nr:type II toxin-antitoxin system RelE/ParE family toxin [Acidobacteriota bacterium]